MKQPRHRRPSFMQTPAALRTYLQSDFARKQGPTMASEYDSFSYNPRDLDEWTLSSDLSKKIPAQLFAEVEGWQAAGAAVSTGIHRLERLDADALYRGWPAKKTGHLSRATSNAGSESACASPPSSQSPLPSYGHSDPIHQLPRLITCLSNMSATSDAIIDTPPFTPDEGTTSMPFIPRAGRRSIEPSQGHDGLQTLEEDGAMVFDTPPRMPTSPVLGSPTLSAFDEGSWEVYTRQYAAELESLCMQELVRFRHIRRGIDKLLVVPQSVKDAETTEWREEFETWWERMGEKQQAQEKIVHDFKMPGLDSVKQERVIHGLSL